MNTRKAGATLSLLFLFVAYLPQENVAHARLKSKRMLAQVAAQAGAPVIFRINPSQSKFMVRAYPGGLLWFLGHGHHVAVRDFSGEAQATPGGLLPASLKMTVNAASLEETGEKFTDEQRKMITNSMRKEVLQADEYPEMNFTSTSVTATKIGEDEFNAKISGDFTLHGVTRTVVIPARVKLTGDSLHANGEFSVRRSEYKVKTHSVKAGMIRVRNRVKFVFDIVASRA